MATVVRSLHRYPVKSMLGESLQECAVDERGLLADRAYALLDVEQGTVASAKDPRRWGALLTFAATFVEEPVAGQDAPPVLIAFPDGSRHRSDDPDVDDALSAALGRPVQLIREPPADARFDEVWPEIEGLAPQQFIDATRHGAEAETGESVSRIALGSMAPAGTFFDLAPLHLLTTATLDRLHELAVESGSDPDFDPRRYRPNLLLGDDGAEGDGGEDDGAGKAGDGFLEDDWVGSTLTVGGAQVSVSMLTMRCVMTTLGQREVYPDADTLRTIARHHRREIPGLGTWACAGVYAGVAAAGLVRVGDTVG
jgi:uncharacterized protein YcbX